MTPPRARILPAGDPATVTPLMQPGLPPGRARRIAREDAEARFAADRAIQDARATAQRILEEAEARAQAIVAERKRAADEEVEARLAARWLALRSAEVARFGTPTDHWVPLAVALAERLVVTTIDLTPEHMVSLVRGVLAEARGARRATIDCHPEDAATLRSHLAELRVDLETLALCEDASLSRGSVRLHTEVGTLDARLEPRLKLLAAALRDALL